MNQQRHELTDAQWERLAPLLPPAQPERGRPNHDHRRVVNGMLWRLTTGAPWRDLPAQYGPWQTVYSRFRRWQQAGVWERALADLQRQGDAAGNLDWTLHFVDGSVVRAHQHAAGGKGGPLLRRSAGVAAASAPRFTSAPSAVASRSSLP
jgi:transposase